jgi:hypothetical protein
VTAIGLKRQLLRTWRVAVRSASQAGLRCADDLGASGSRALGQPPKERCSRDSDRRASVCVYVDRSECRADDPVHAVGAGAGRADHASTCAPIARGTAGRPFSSHSTPTRMARSPKTNSPKARGTSCVVRGTCIAPIERRVGITATMNPGGCIVWSADSSTFSIEWTPTATGRRPGTSSWLASSDAASEASPRD